MRRESFHIWQWIRSRDLAESVADLTERVTGDSCQVEVHGGHDGQNGFGVYRVLRTTPEGKMVIV